MRYKLRLCGVLMLCAIGLVAGASSAALAETVDLLCVTKENNHEFHLLIDFDARTVTYFLINVRDPSITVQAKITDTQVTWRTTNSGFNDERVVDYTLSRDTGVCKSHQYPGGSPDGTTWSGGDSTSTCAKAARAF